MLTPKFDEFTKLAKDKYDEVIRKEKNLKKQLSELKTEKQAFKNFLVAKGIIKKQSRKRQPPSAE